MEILKEKIEQIQIQYTITDGEWTYMDNFIFDQKEYEKLGGDEIEKMIIDKYSVWKNYVTTPTLVPTKTEQREKLLRLQKDKENLEKEIESLGLMIK